MRVMFGAAMGAALVGLAFAGCGGGVEATGGTAGSSSQSGSGSGISSSSAAGMGGAASTSSSSSGAGGGVNVKVIEQFCTTAGAAFCDALFACCADPMVLQQYGGTVAACKAKAGGPMCFGNQQIMLENSLLKGETVFDQQQYNACLAELKAMAAGGAACVAPAVILFHADCVSAFRGQIAPGAACTWVPDDLSFVQCKDGLCEMGKCVGFLKAGDPCDPNPKPSWFCNFTQGQWCQGSAPVGACGPRGNIGDMCAAAGTTTPQCKSLTCDVSGKCALPSAATACTTQ